MSYYPETAGDDLDGDIAHMHEIGINHVRFGEFAWSVMEPREGEYDFSLQESALAKFAKAGIGVVLCTPTAAPPVWLCERHPEILRVNELGFPQARRPSRGLPQFGSLTASTAAGSPKPWGNASAISRA